MIVYYAAPGGPLNLASVGADLAGQRTGEAYATWYQCPITLAAFRNLFVVRADRDFTLGVDTHRLPDSWTDAPTVSLGVETYWWADRDVDVEFSHPFAHPGPLHGPGFVAPARISVPEWFRHAKPGYQFYPGHGHTPLRVTAGDPLFYVKIHADEPVVIEHMPFTDDLRTLAAERVAIMHAERHLPARWSDWDAQGHPHDRATWRERLDVAAAEAVAGR
jgi:hypothetical protein